MKTSMKIYTNQRKKSTKNSKIPFYLRIIHNGKKSEARLNVSEISEEYLKKWSQETQRFNMKLSREIESIRLLNNKFQFFENRFNLLLNSQTNIDFPSQLRNYILERDEFSKNKEVNNNSLLGYYAEVKLTNNSTDKIELFALGSEVTESSK